MFGILAFRYGSGSAGSVYLTNGLGSLSGSCSFLQWPSRRLQKIINFDFFCLLGVLPYFLKINLHNSSMIKCHKEVRKVGIKVFLTISAWWWKDPDPYPYLDLYPDPNHCFWRVSDSVWFNSCSFVVRNNAGPPALMYRYRTAYRVFVRFWEAVNYISVLLLSGIAPALSLSSAAGIGVDDLRRPCILRSELLFPRWWDLAFCHIPNGSVNFWSRGTLIKDDFYPFGYRVPNRISWTVENVRRSDPVWDPEADPKSYSIYPTKI